MAALQKFPQQLSVNTRMGADSYGSCKAAGVEVSDQFPAGMRVLVVDDDTTCLKILEQMLQRCSYCVTTCSQATDALRLLRERKGCFDLVLSDVHMPDMDGYKLLEHVGLEMDLPVIMMSADGTTSAVMKGIRHGACDYLIKPVREEELKNIWQHVVRKKRNGNKELEHLGSFEDNDRNKRGSDDTEFTSSVNEGSEGMLKAQKKKRDVKEEDDGELESDDPSASKKPRVVWSVELHQQFVTAVNQLGIDKAVPKRILELMNVPGLTRENVASHLQKFRLYLKKLSGIAQQQSGIPDLLLGPTEPNTIQGSSLGRYDIQALVASGKIPPQIYAALNAELLGRSTGSLMLPTMNHPSLVQAPSLQGPKCLSVEQCAPFGHPLMKSQSSTSKQLPQSVMSVEDVSSGFGTWPGTGRDVLLPGSSCSINVQPSCLVVPSQLSSSSFNMGNSPASVNQNSGFSSPFSLPSINIPFSIPSNNSSLSVGEVSNKSTCVLSGYLGVDNNASQQSRNSSIMFGGARQTPEVVPGMYNFGGNVDEQGLPRNHGFVGKVTCVPSQFALDELESPTSNLNVGQIYMEIGENRVKQEPNLGFMENARLGIPMSQHYPPNDLTGVFLD